MSTLEAQFEKSLSGPPQFVDAFFEKQVSTLYLPETATTYQIQYPLQEAIYPSQYATSSLKASQIVQQFQERRDDAESSSRLRKQIIDGGSLLIQGGLSVYGGPIGGIYAMMVGAATNELKEGLLNNTFKEAKNKLSLDLARYRDTHSDFGLLLEIDDDDPQVRGKKRYEMLYSSEHPVLNPALDNIPEEGKGLVQGTLIKMLADADKQIAGGQMILFEEMFEQGEELRSQGLRLEDVEKRLMDHNQTFLNFATKTRDDMKSLGNRVTKIQEGLSSISGRVAENERKIDENSRLIQENSDDIEANRVRTEENRNLIAENSKDIDFMKEYMFGKMDPKEQIVALKGQIFDGMDPQKKAQLLEKAELAAERQEIISTMTTLTNGANDLLGIADNLGIDVDPSLRKVVNVGTGLVNAGLAFASGNYLGAILSVTSVLGIGGKKDAGAERHKQVMQALGQLAQGQSKILENQGHLFKLAELNLEATGQVLENQKVMFEFLQGLDEKLIHLIEGQGQIYGGVVQLSNQIHRHHEVMVRQHADIVKRLVMIRFDVRAAVDSGIPSCGTAYGKMLDHPGFVKDENHFTSYEAIERYYADNRHHLKQALEALTNRSTNAGSTNDSTFFQLGALEVEDPQEDAKNLAMEHYDLLRAFAVQEMAVEEKLEVLLASGIHPVGTVQAIDEKLAYIEEQDRGDRLPERFKILLNTDPDERAEVSRLIVKLYDPTFVRKFAKYAYRFHWLLPLFSSDIGSDLISFEDVQEGVLGNRHIPESGKTLLSDCMIRLDIAIAQQSLLQGDLLLPIFYQLMKEGRTEANQAKYDQMTALFNGNYILAKNALLYALKKNVPNEGDNYYNYYLAMAEERGPERLQEIAGKHFQYIFNQETKRWHIELGEWKGEQALEMPGAVELLDGKMILTPEMEKLLSTRKRLAQEIALFDLPKDLSSSNREVYLRSVAFRV